MQATIDEHSSPAMKALVERVHELEALPEMTKTLLKATLMHDSALDWRGLRSIARLLPSYRPQNWKSDLINSLLSRKYTHGGCRSGCRRSRVNVAAPVMTAALVNPLPATGERPVEAGSQANIVLAVLHLLSLLRGRACGDARAAGCAATPETDVGSTVGRHAAADTAGWSPNVEAQRLAVRHHPGASTRANMEGSRSARH